MANNGIRRSVGSRLLPLFVAVVTIAALAGLYAWRTQSNEASRPETVDASSGEISELPASLLTRTAYQDLTGDLAPVPGTEPDHDQDGTPDWADDDYDPAENDRDSDGTPDADDPDYPGSAPGAQDSSTPATPAAQPDSDGDGVPDEQEPDAAGADGDTLLLMDGWSVALAGGPTVDVVDEEAKAAGTVTFVPLGGRQLRGLLARSPQAVETLLARMATSSDKVSCTADGCTAGGDEIDLDQLAKPASIPGLGDVYSGNAITSGVWAARLPGAGKVLTVSSGTSSTTLSSLASVNEDGSPVTVADGPLNGYGTSTWVLGAGLGRVFPLEAAWIRTDPAAYERSGTLYTTTTAAQLSGGNAYVDVLLTTPVSDTSAADSVALLSPSQMTYITSPTTGCGTVVLCTPEKVAVKVVGFDSAATIACLSEPSSTPENRAVLLSQVATLTFTTRNPAIMAGTWDAPEQAGVIGVDITQAQPKTGERTFTQQGVFVIDDAGIRSVSGGREVPVLGFSDPKLLSGAYVSCSQPADGTESGESAAIAGDAGN